MSLNGSFSPSGGTLSPWTWAIRLDQPGPASTLTLVRQPLGLPGPGEARVAHTRIGVNYVDIYHRQGSYSLPTWPSGLGVEAVGVIEALGPDTEYAGLRAGQRVAYAGPPVGAYSGARILPVHRLIPLPEGVDDGQVAALLLRGITAHMLFSRVRALAPGETILVHGAAGGLGLVLVQWAKALGARVIGAVGSRAKAELARAHGLDEAVLYREESLVERVQQLTQGRGVEMVIDGIGGDTLVQSLTVAAPFGTVASIGQVAGTPGSLNLDWLGPARSVALARPGVFRFMGDPAAYREGAAATLARIAQGLVAHVDGVLPLSLAAEAHSRLESGQTRGALLLDPRA